MTAHHSPKPPHRHPHRDQSGGSTPSGKTWRVSRIETEPITADHYTVAVATLASLITQWENNQQNTDQEKAA